MALDKNKNIIMFKYERTDYNCSEACSEKLAYEIAKILGYKCARIELALDENMVFGVLNYLFSNEFIHMDTSAFLNKYESERKKYYIGYVPRYYSKQLLGTLKSGTDYSAMIKSLNFESELSDEYITTNVKIIFNI